MRNAIDMLLRGVLLAAIVTTGAAGQGAARVPSEAIEYALAPDYTSADLELLVQQLELDDGQRAVIDTLLTDHEAAFAAGSRDLRRRITAERAAPSVDAARRATLQELREAAVRLREETRRTVQENTDPEVRQKTLAAYHAEIRALQDRLRGQTDTSAPPMDDLDRAIIGTLDRWEETRRECQAALETNLIAVLSELQRERWPAVARRLRRERALPRGVLSGESTDLFRIVRELELTPSVRADLQPVLAQFDLALDGALRTRDDPAARALLREVRELDAETRVAAVNRRLAQHLAVREVNEQMAAAGAAALPPVAARRFRDRAKRLTYASVFRPTREARIFQAAHHLDGLDEDTLAAVAALERAYLAELAPLNERHCALIVEHERERVRRRLGGTGGDARPNGGPSAAAGAPLREATDGRRALGARYLERLRALLPPEAYAGLPGIDDQGTASGLVGQAWVRERFDENDDGELSAEELARLREFLGRREDR